MSRKSQFGFVLPKSELRYQEILNPDYSLPSNPSCISSKISLAKIGVVFVQTFTTRISAVKIRVKFDEKFTTRISTLKKIKVAFVTKLTPVPPKNKAVFRLAEGSAFGGKVWHNWRTSHAVTKVSVHRLFSCSFQS